MRDRRWPLSALCSRWGTVPRRSSDRSDSRRSGLSVGTDQNAPFRPLGQRRQSCLKGKTGRCRNGYDRHSQEFPTIRPLQRSQCRRPPNPCLAISRSERRAASIDDVLVPAGLHEGDPSRVSIFGSGLVPTLIHRSLRVMKARIRNGFCTPPAALTRLRRFLGPAPV